MPSNEPKSEPQKKQKWYGVRLRIFDYTTRQLTVAVAIIGFIITLLIIPVASSHGRLPLSQIRPILAPMIGMFVAGCFAIFYRKAKQLPEPGSLNWKSQLGQLLLGIVISGSMIGVWALFLSRGFSSETISSALSITGAVLLVVSVTLSVVLHLKNKL